MVRRAVLEAVGRDDAEVARGGIAEPEAAGIQQMRAEVRQNAAAVVAPCTVADQEPPSVAVEHAAAVDLPPGPRGAHITPPVVMRFAGAVVWGGTINRGFAGPVLPGAECREGRPPG